MTPSESNIPYINIIIGFLLKMEPQKEIKLIDSWKNILIDEFDKPHMLQLKKFLVEEKKKGKTIYPPSSEIFNALNLLPFDQIKVVILGQDPYHGPGQAHGLCFSVREGTPNPPSLQNIFKEIEQEFGAKPTKGDLTNWTNQGVLLLNATLTVEKDKAGSHQKKGWEEFTDRVIAELNKNREHLVFLLWGSYAQNKGQFIDTKKHLVLKSPHPSPLSAHRGFLGCGHFKKANEYLVKNGLEPIKWV